MKLGDIERRVRDLIPRYSRLYSDFIPVDVTSWTSQGVVCSSVAHGLTNGEAIVLPNVYYMYSVASIVLTGTHLQLSFTGGTDATVGSHISLSGFSDLDLNTSHEVIHKDINGDLLIEYTGSVTLVGGETAILETFPLLGLQNVTVVDLDTFLVESTIADANYYIPEIAHNIRVFPCVNVDSALSRLENEPDSWLLVLLGDGDVSKSPYTSTSEKHSFLQGEEIRIRLNQSYYVYALQNRSNEYSGVKSIDDIGHYTLPAIVKCLMGVTFESGFDTTTRFASTLESFGLIENTARRLVYQYSFSQTSDISEEDSATDQFSTAYTSMTYIHKPFYEEP